MSTPFKVVIPARYASVRLPGKALREIAGKPMVLHVHDRACESQAAEVVVATDDQRIADVVTRAGAKVCLTRSEHRSGTERIAEVSQVSAWPEDTIIVNLQGDEPCMPAALIDQVALDMASHEAAQVTTLATAVEDRKVLFDPHAVKVVMDRDGYAMYFSRAPIPWHRDEFLAESGPLPSSVGFWRHIGLYAFRAGFLRSYVGWQASALELAESLEQLRVLWHGGRIHVSEAHVDPGHGVDTLGDLQRAERLLGRDGSAG